ncbi:MAG: 5-methyltetrahydropteroyltriglutamate--homocysteine S-methyltransferase [Clostridiales bacterium]|jgi:5-methyltetrahydropteroyltriglutamate--homocysteine methyltransferase|nr:5-methyltetrahydropteroyltriglutamate--homocysteine S-methyltransferase [Clostridiales bacterium]
MNNISGAAGARGQKLKTAVIGFPRIGERRQLKFATEKYFRSEITEGELLDVANRLKKERWAAQGASGIDYITVGDFSLYDGLLDVSELLNCVPARYKRLGLSNVGEYFAVARGYQGEKGDVKALPMKKWFNTNYHYIVPEIDGETVIRVEGTKIFDEYEQARAVGIDGVPALIGGFTFLKLAKIKGGRAAADCVPDIIAAYKDIIRRLAALGAKCVRLDEPFLATDLSRADVGLFAELYSGILSEKSGCKVFLQTYFGDIRDCYERAIALDFDGIGLDFVEGKALDLLKKYGFPKTKTLFAGVVSGKNIWRTSYKDALTLLDEISRYAADVVIGVSCSLSHVPYTVKNEVKLGAERVKHLSFAIEKLAELKELSELFADGKGADCRGNPIFDKNAELFASPRVERDEEVADRVAALKASDFVRLPELSARRQRQRETLCLPLFPTTTIGSFPQTDDVKRNRAAFKNGEITADEYEAFNKAKIAACIALQEEIGLDVLVHGEYERNDMVEYFGESLGGFVFTENGWVQSYGTRTVKPPIIWGDVKRLKPITVGYAVYAQSLTQKPVKGMLTGPITILNWSFPRGDVSVWRSAAQIALAIRDEVADLEANGIKVIQIDEAAIREKLPLRKADWNSQYLDKAVPTFRLVHARVKPETQIHTHMCYSEFDDIIKEIEAMDADVISFEASRSDMTILDSLQKNAFASEVGPGLYDIHSPRVPSVSEIKAAIGKAIQKIDKSKLWINPDCGLKTRGEFETKAGLKNLVTAAKCVRKSLSE